MDRIDKEQLYNTAWKHWGGDLQIDILIEEMAELTQALIKDRRNRFRDANTLPRNPLLNSIEIRKEFADVIICMEQMELRFRQTKLMYDSIPPKPLPRKIGTMWDQIEEFKEAKLLRLKERLMQSMTNKLWDTTVGNSGGNR